MERIEKCLELTDELASFHKTDSSTNLIKMQIAFASFFRDKHSC